METTDMHKYFIILSLSTLFFLQAPNVFAATEITGTITAKRGDRVQVEFQGHKTAAPKAGDKVNFTKKLPGLPGNVTADAGNGTVIEVDGNSAWVQTSDNRPKLKMDAVIHATGNPVEKKKREVPDDNQQPASVGSTNRIDIEPSQQAGAEKRNIWREPTTGMAFVFIKPGTFMMGSPSNESRRRKNERQHQVTLTCGYYLQTTEVTQGQWKRVMGRNPSRFDNCGDDCPVEQVSWNAVQVFIGKLNQKEGSDKYRLPSEAEWEYAARAGSSSSFYFGDSFSQLGNYAWYASNSGKKTHAVGQKQPNAWGLYNMHGNVSEWCQDWFGDYPSGSVTDPQGPSSGEDRVKRGGGWLSLSGNCRSAYRDEGAPVLIYGGLGFRLARTP